MLRDVGNSIIQPNGFRGPNKTGKSPTGVGVHNRGFVIGSKRLTVVRAFRS